MSVEIFNLDFWRTRLANAKENGNAFMATGFAQPWDDVCNRNRLTALDYLKEGGRVLDIGCGIGRSAGWFDPKNYLGIDFVPEFIEEARKLHPEHKFEVVDLRDPLPYGDKEFDLAFAVAVIGMIRGNEGNEIATKVEQEMVRVAKTAIYYGMDNSEVIALCISK